MLPFFRASRRTRISISDERSAMTATLVSMTVPIVVLLIVGAVTLGLAYWAALVSEGKDEWLTGEESKPEYFWPSAKPFVIPPDGPYTVTAWLNGKTVEAGPFQPGDRVGLKALSDGTFGVVKLEGTTDD